MISHDLDRAISVIEKSQSFLLTCHVSPDADALGSIIAMGLALEELGKKVEWYNQDEPSASLQFLPGVDRFTTKLDVNKRYDVVITGDSGELSRIGKTFQDFKNYKHLINVDHHLTNTQFGDINVIDANAPSTGSIMLELIKKLGAKITPEIATAVYVTIVTDTGSFQYRNTTQEAFQVSEELIEKGANPAQVAEELYFSFPAEKLLLLQRVLNTLEFSEDRKYASIVLKHQDLKEINVDRDVAEDFIDHPRSVKSVKVAAYFKEIGENKYKLSLRSKGQVNVSAVCSYFGGGGHFSASGCVLNGSLEEVKKQVYEQSAKAIIQAERKN